MIVAVGLLQAIGRVPQTDTARIAGEFEARGQARPVVGHLDLEAIGYDVGEDVDGAAVLAAGDGVLDGVLDQRLQQQARHLGTRGGRRDADVEPQSILGDLLDLEPLSAFTSDSSGTRAIGSVSSEWRRKLERRVTMRLANGVPARGSASRWRSAC